MGTLFDSYGIGGLDGLGLVGGFGNLGYLDPRLTGGIDGVFGGGFGDLGNPTNSAPLGAAQRAFSVVSGGINSANDLLNSFAPFVNSAGAFNDAISTPQFQQYLQSILSGGDGLSSGLFGSPTTSQSNLFGIPGTDFLDDILRGIYSGGGVLGPDDPNDYGILGDLGGILGSLGSSIFGGLFGSDGGGGLLESIFGGGGDSALGGGGDLSSLLPLLLLGGGLTGLFNNEAENKTRTTPPFQQENELVGINTDLAKQNLLTSQNQFANQAPQNNFLRSLFDQQNRELTASGLALTPEQRAQIDANRRQTIGGLEPFDQALGGGLLADFNSAGRATPDQLANIQGSADSAISRGLSDLGRFRDEGLNQVKLNSARRGLRPTDTPIQNDFADVQQDANRKASDFVSGIRQQQFLQNLQFPLQAQQLRLGQFGAGQDSNARRRELEERLGTIANEQRSSFGNTAQQGGQSLLGSFNPTSALGAFTGVRTGNSTQTSTPGSLDTLARIFQGLGTLGSGLR